MQFIDDVYEDPGIQRENALGLPFCITKLVDKSPGKSVDAPFNMKSQLVLKVQQHFQQQGKNIVFVKRTFRVSMENDLSSSCIHTDTFHYHVIVSLSPNHDSQDDFEQVFQLKSKDGTTLQSIDFLRERFDSHYANYISKNTQNSSFEEIDRIKFKYNRAIIINSCCFHYPSKPSFGDSHENARLVEILALNDMGVLLLRSPTYIRFFWLFRDVFGDSMFKSIVEHVQQYANVMMSTSPSSLPCNQLLHLEESIIARMVQTYISFVIDNTNEIFCLFNDKQREGHSLKLNCSLLGFPESSHGSNWQFSLVDGASAFLVVIHLNNNSSPFTILDLFNNEKYLIPSLANSMLILPYSWLYPLRQTFVEEGYKQCLKIIVSFS